MNKQELIEKLADLKKDSKELFDGGSREKGYEVAIKLAKQLDEPKECKIVIQHGLSKCSNCGLDLELGRSSYTHYCMNCGAKIKRVLE